MTVAMPISSKAGEQNKVRGGLGPTGRLRHGELSTGDRSIAIFVHISPFFFLIGLGPIAFAIPLVLWLVRREQSAFVDDHGREFMNFALSFIVLHLLMAITLVGLLLLPVLWVVAVVSLIRAAVAAGQNEYFRYPVTLRFLP